MEDQQNAVFHSEGLFYKQLLPIDIAENLENKFNQIEQGWQDGAKGIARGLRRFLDLSLDDFPEMKKLISIALKDYFPDLELSNWIRYYQHKCGDVKPHTDGSKDSAQYTLLLYLNDDFEGGQLNIKIPRSENEINTDQPQMKHKRFVFIPRIGFGVIFSKSMLHWAEEVIDGNKNFLLLEIRSKF